LGQTEADDESDGSNDENDGSLSFFFFGCFESWIWKFHSSDSIFMSDCVEHLESQSETMNLMVTAKTQVDLDSMDLVAKEAQTIGASAGMLSQRDSEKHPGAK